MLHMITITLSGALFGLGLSLAGMLNPAKIQGFLDITGNWDPSLAFVMGGGMMVNLMGYRLLNKHKKPLFSTNKTLPKIQKTDMALILGSLIFGIGWAITGLCPGPIIASIGLNPSGMLAALCLLLLGLACGNFCKQLLTSLTYRTK